MIGFKVERSKLLYAQIHSSGILYNNNCLFQSTACLIRGYCFADSAQNPLNSHYACKIDRSTTDWSK